MDELNRRSVQSESVVNRTINLPKMLVPGTECMIECVSDGDGAVEYFILDSSSKCTVQGKVIIMLVVNIYKVHELSYNKHVCVCACVRACVCVCVTEGHRK